MHHMQCSSSLELSFDQQRSLVLQAEQLCVVSGDAVKCARAAATPRIMDIIGNIAPASKHRAGVRAACWLDHSHATFPSSLHTHHTSLSNPNAVPSAQHTAWTFML